MLFWSKKKVARSFLFLLDNDTMNCEYFNSFHIRSYIKKNYAQIMIKLRNLQ